MRIFTSYYGKRVTTGEDIEKISISAGVPNWFRGKSCFDLAPTKEIRSMPIGVYEGYYEKLIRGRETKIRTFLDEIIKEGKDIILYCYEKDPKECHRHVAAKVLKDWGYDVCGEYSEQPKEENEVQLSCF